MSKFLGLTLLWVFERLVNLAEPDRPFYKPSDFPWVREVEESWDEIREELLDLLSSRDEIPNLQDIFEEQKQLTTGNEWKSYMLYFYGYRIHRNCSRCPKTAALVQSIPGMKTAMFSILAGGKHIKPHRGPFKGVLRYHLGLVIPEPYTDCEIRVGSETRNWQHGESLILDDTLEHEAWNKSTEDRVILFVDFQRELPKPISMINVITFTLIQKSPFVQNVLVKLSALK